MEDRLKYLKEWRKTITHGDKVRIRKWADMASEFGVIDGNEIPCELQFPIRMRMLSGEIVEVKSPAFKTIATIQNFNVSRDMVEPINESDMYTSKKVILNTIETALNRRELKDYTNRELLNELERRMKQPVK